MNYEKTADQLLQGTPFFLHRILDSLRFGHTVGDINKLNEKCQ